MTDLKQAEKMPQDPQAAGKPPELIRVDLHCHSSLSDGTLTPEQVAKNLFESGVTYAALTDHNTLTGLVAFQRALMRLGIGFVTGLEITTAHRNQVVHLLAYGFDAEYAELKNLLGETVNNGDSITNPALRVFRTAHEMIDLVHRAGGIVILAHPLQTEPDIYRLEKLIAELHQFGLDGIEAIYSQNDRDMVEQLLQIADERKLVVSAGTDYHTVNGVNPGINIDVRRWKSFRDAVLKKSISFSVHEKGPALRMLEKKKNPWFSFVSNIFLPAFLSLALFIVALFFILLPYFEKTLLERKQENIRQLTQVAWGVLNEAAEEVDNGQLTLEQAQSLAKNRIAAMRYGIDNKDYFWLQDLSPRILMHPYRSDLNDQDVTEFMDAQGTRIFVAFADLVREQGEGYISYVWQWMDDLDRMEPKESYIRLFEPWGWIIGTGIYVYDVQAEIANLRSYIVRISLVIIAVVLLLLVYLVRQGMLLEQSRNDAEKLLLESTERYRALSESATEGALFVYDGRCRYANTVMYELLGCTPDTLELLDVQDIFPDVQENKAWLKILAAGYGNEPPVMISGVLQRCDNSRLNCSLTIKDGLDNPRSGFMILVRRAIDITEHAGSHLALNRLLHLPKSIAADLAESIRTARRIDEVVSLCTKKSELVVSLLENGTSSIAIAYMISRITDMATQRLVDLCIESMGPPPAAFSFLALGSHGRQSQTLFSDQDNALVYQTVKDEDDQASAHYFLKLATRVCNALEEAGYKKCVGGKVASNPQWCKPLHVWKGYFEEWIRSCEPQQVVEFSIFFDLRSVAGDDAPALALRNHINPLLQEIPFFISQVAQNALIFKTPMRLFGTIVTSGGKEHSGRIDVKSPAMAIVSFARLYALKHNIQETNTLVQLDAIKNLGVILDAKHRNLVTAYETLLRLRLWNQALAIRQNRQLDNWIDPGQLGQLEETILRECFNEIDELHNLIQRDFLA